MKKNGIQLLTESLDLTLEQNCEKPASSKIFVCFKRNEDQFLSFFQNLFLRARKAPESRDITMPANETTSRDDGGVMMVQVSSLFCRIRSDVFPPWTLKTDLQKYSRAPCHGVPMEIKTTLDEYSSEFLEADRTVPQISMDCAMKTADLIEPVTLKDFKPRKENGALDHESGIIMKP